MYYNTLKILFIPGAMSVTENISVSLCLVWPSSSISKIFGTIWLHFWMHYSIKLLQCLRNKYITLCMHISRQWCIFTSSASARVGYFSNINEMVAVSLSTSCSCNGNLLTQFHSKMQMALLGTWRCYKNIRFFVKFFFRNGSFSKFQRSWGIATIDGGNI